MSDNTSEEQQQQQMKEIWICADVWYEVFALVSPSELGQRMALISNRFDRLVDVHFKTRKWSLGSMGIYRATDGNGAEIVKGSRKRKRLPIPQGPLPSKVIGFQWIRISYVDQTVIEFLQRIRRLFDSSGTTVEIHTFENQSRSWEIIWQKIWPLLTTPREDGRPTMLHCDYPWGGMDRLKRSFVNASTPVNFIIRLHSFSGTEPFELKNNWTGERLTLLDEDDDDDWDNKWVLVRCPIVREEAKWAAWETEAIEWQWHRQWNRIDINLKDSAIGDDLVDAKAGPSEPSE